ncbi:MAG: response regulator [Nitrosopumilus sp.]|nr:MAG: response regulator [Nitrosopumilus sp.]
MDELMTKNVLLIDDNQKIRELFTSYLQLKGYQVKVLESGVGAVDEVASKTYDVIILDLAMPEVSGFEVLDEMVMKKLSTENVIVLTAADLSEKEQEKIKAYKIKAFLEKPAELSTIMALISC